MPVLKDIPLSLRTENKAYDFFVFIGLLVPLFLILGRAVADVTMGLVSLGFLVSSLKHKNWQWVKTPWFIMALVTWAYLIISAAFADFDHTAAFVSALGWLRFPLFAMAFVEWLSRSEKARRYWPCMLIVLLTLIAIDTIWQFAFGVSLSGHPDPHYGGRLSGPFTRLVVGIFLCHLAWPASGFLFAKSLQEKIDKKAFLFACAFCALMGGTILISGERIAFILFGLCAFLFALFAKRIRVFLLGCGVLTLCAAVAFVLMNPTLHARFVTNTTPYLENMKDSPYAAVWGNGLAAWRHSPLLGVGPNNFVPACETLGFEGGFVNELSSVKKLACARHPHNIYIEWLAETGLLGLGCFLGLIIFWGRSIFKNLRDSQAYGSQYYIQLGYALALLTFLWPIASTMSFFSNWSATLFWWTLGLTLQKPWRLESV